MARPVVSKAAEALYEALLPLAYQDESNQWALLHYCEAYVGKLQEVEDLARDSDDGPGWSSVVDVDRAAYKGLPWLGQFVGLTTPAKTIFVDKVNRLANPSFEVDKTGWSGFGVVSSAWSKYGTKSIYYLETRADGIAAVLQTSNLADYPVTPGKEITFVAHMNVLNTGAASGNRIDILFYASDMVTNTGGLYGTEYPLGESRQVVTGIVPAGSAYARARVRVDFTDAVSDTIELYVEACMLIDGPDPSGYFDGDQPNARWTGTPHASKSELMIAETDLAHESRIRDYIRATGGFARGTPAAIRGAAQQFLTGTKTVILNERLNGNAYQLRVTTWNEETPDPSKVEIALREQKPAGIVLTYASVPKLSYDALDASYASYDAIDAAHTSYDDIDNG